MKEKNRIKYNIIVSIPLYFLILLGVMIDGHFGVNFAQVFGMTLLLFILVEVCYLGFLLMTKWEQDLHVRN